MTTIPGLSHALRWGVLSVRWWEKGALKQEPPLLPFYADALLQ